MHECNVCYEHVHLSVCDYLYIYACMHACILILALPPSLSPLSFSPTLPLSHSLALSAPSLRRSGPARTKPLFNLDKLKVERYQLFPAENASESLDFAETEHEGG